MTGYVLFWMQPWLRQSLIAGHTFYFAQARKRLLSQFQNMDAEADAVARQWLEENKQRFDPDFHDDSDFFQWAEDLGIEFYQLLSDMKEQTSLGIVAGMFHAWDKQLRDWLMQQIGHWQTGDNVKAAIWKANFHRMGNLLTTLGWNLASTAYWQKLDECRLVVNAYKHGEGTALVELNAKHPEYFAAPFGSRKAKQGRYLATAFLTTPSCASPTSRSNGFRKPLFPFGKRRLKRSRTVTIWSYPTGSPRR